MTNANLILTKRKPFFIKEEYCNLPKKFKWTLASFRIYSTVKPLFAGGFGGKETSAVNRGSRLIGVLLVYNTHIKPYLGEEIGRGKSRSLR